MEVWCKDPIAMEKCDGKHQKVVALAHAYLGLASVVSVSDVPERKVLQLETARGGAILVDYDLTESLGRP